MEDTEEYLDRLRAVFELFDTEKRGFITVDHFVDLAQEHFGAEESQSQEINSLVRVLDEEGDGKIYFQEFCRGVQQILTLNSPRDLTTEGLAQSPSRDIGSEETLVAAEDDANSCGNTSELSTFNEYDMMTDDDGGATVQPEISSSPPTGLLINFDDDVDSAVASNAPLSNGQEYRRDLDLTTDEEERFEYNGDAEENESDTESKPSSHNNLLLGPLNGGEVRRPPRHRERRDWLKPRRASIAIGGGRRVTSSSLASQLYRGSPVNVTGSRRSSTCSENILEDIDGSFSQLNDKVKQLESQIVFLNDTQSRNDDRHLRLREENSFLVERVHILEEQLRDVEIKAQNKIHEEEKKNRDFMSRTDKDKTAEIEILSQSLQHIEREYQVLQEEAPRLRSEVERLKRENVHLEEKLNETQFNLHNLSEEHQETLEKLQQQRDEMVQERVVHAQLLDELGKELQELRNYKMESEERSRLHAPSPKDIPSLHKRELENHIVRLKEENVRLKEQNDDLQAQVLGMQVREGRNLLATGSTLADELQTLPRDELLQKLQEQRDENAKLREYVDSIILRIMEKNPDLLEVDSPTPEKKNKRGILSILKKS